MRLLTTIKGKLLLLQLATILLILLLIAGSFAVLVERFYYQQADQGFARLYNELSVQLRERETTLSSLAQRIALRDDVVASVNMLYQYARPDDYQPLIYDSEKQALARELSIEARAAGVDEIALYGADSTLIGFFSRLSQGRSGYLSFSDGEPRPMLATGDNGGSSWEAGRLPETLHERLPHPRLVEGAVRYHGSGSSIVAEYRTPIYRTFPDGEQMRVGLLVARQYVTETLLGDLSDKTGIDFSLRVEGEEPIGKGPALTPEQLARTSATNIVTEQLPFSRNDLGEYFTASMALRLVEGRQALFVATVPKEEIATAIGNTLTLVVVVLLLSVVVILPLGLILVHRTISRPLERLTRGAEAYESGNYGARVELDSNDELAQLAHAFNAMGDSIHQRELMLLESETKYRNLVDNLPQRVFFKDRNFIYVSCNRPFAQDVDLEPDAVVGKSDFDLFSESHARQYRLDDDRIMRKGEIEELDESFSAGGVERVIHTVKTPIRDSEGDVVGILGIFWDVTEKRQAESKLRQSAAVFENTADGVIVTDAEARIIAVNKAFCEISGYSEEEALGQRPSFRRSERQDRAFYRHMWRAIERSGRWQGEIWNRRKDGEVYPEWMTISTVRDGDGRITNYVAVFSDITHVKRSQMQLDHMAHHDPLTDLPNRTLFNDRLHQAIRRAERNDGTVAVLFIDLDRFKNVNDTLGHPVGDLLLQDVARRLQNLLREEDTVARLSGDEFIVLIEDLERPEVAEGVARKVIDKLSHPFSVHGNELFIGASIGISLYPDDGHTAANLVKYADTAMYRAKEEGRNTYQFYTQELTDSVVERMELEAALRRALERDQLELHYQPQVDLAQRRIIGAEALLRWTHPELGNVPPDKFIPLAEESGMIIEIGDWVLQQACTQAVAWARQYEDFRRIAVNLSGVQIQRRDIVDKVAAVLRRTGLEPHLLELEITESVLMHYPEIAAETLQGLRNLGVELAIDDFGTGYSSMSYLKRFPIQNLKIDRSFVMDIPKDSNDTAITRAVIALGKSLQLSVIAEGVETAEQVEFLLHEGCDMGQGYYFSRPIPPGPFRDLLEAAPGDDAEAI
ncbi:MAG: EAL domain-containing protein [Pseudomonadota bacterium]